MVDLAREAFSTNNFGLVADIYERTIRESGPTSELYLGLGDSFVQTGQFAKAFQCYTNAYRFGKVTPEKLNHLVTGIIDAVRQETTNSLQVKNSSMFMCGICRGLLADPVTLPCGHTFCKRCIDKDKPCEVCGIVHLRLKTRNLNTNVILTNLIEKWFPDECKAARLKGEGNEYFAVQDYKRAVEVYSQALDIAKMDHFLLSSRSHVYALMEKFEEALIDAENVMLLCPDWPEGYFRKGCALYGLGRYEDAAVSFLQCLALDQKVDSAKEYLTKALDKILSVLTSDDQKAHALEQQNSPNLLQQLIDGNFSQPIFVPDIALKLSDPAESVKSTVSAASRFSGKPAPHTVVAESDGRGTETSEQQEKHERKTSEQQDHIHAVFTQRLRCLSLPDCNNIECAEIQKLTIPRSHSPQPPSPASRKRLRHYSTSQCPVSPTHTLPQKVLKTACMSTVPTLTGPAAATTLTLPTADTSDCAEKDEVRSEQMSVEDLECGLCYRLFYEPVTTPCGHTFCRKCLDRCLDHTVTCPMCKGNLAEYLAERRQVVTDAVQSIIKTYFREAYAERCRINQEEMTELTRMGSGQQSDIPVFVCILAFPTIPCPLHVFEPRYRLMVRQCMESGTRQFGMCMHFGDNEDDFSDYGCMLEIRDVQYFPDGRSVVDTIGGRRFKILSRGKRDGYNTARVEFISDKVIDQEELQTVNSLQAEIHAMVKNWVSKLPTVHRTRIIHHFGELPDIDSNPALSVNGPAWAWWAVAVLPMDPRVQMAMLAMSSSQERLVALKKVLTYMNRRGNQ